MSIDGILLKALSEGLMDIHSFRYYSRVAHLVDNELIFNNKKKVTIHQNTIEKIYVDHVRSKKYG